MGATAAGTTVASGATLALANNIVTPVGESIAIAGAGEDRRGALQSQSGTNTWSGAVSVTASGTRIGVQDGASLAITGNITESAPNTTIVFRAGGTTGSHVTLSETANSWTGETSVFSDTITTGMVKLGRDNALPATTVLDVDNANAPEDAIFDLNGRLQIVTAGSLTLGGFPMPPGTYNASNSPGWITGGGNLLVTCSGGFTAWIDAFPGLTTAQKSPRCSPGQRRRFQSRRIRHWWPATWPASLPPASCSSRAYGTHQPSHNARDVRIPAHNKLDSAASGYRTPCNIAPVTRV